MPTRDEQAVPHPEERGDRERSEHHHRHREPGNVRAREHQLAADEGRGHRRRDGHHRAHRDVDAVGGDHQGEPHGDDHQGRCAVQDVDEAAVEVAVADGDREEVRIGGEIEEEEQPERRQRPEDPLAHHARQ